MTSGQRQDDAQSDNLLTAEDLFGDLVDAPLDPAARPAPATRKAAIRVQVSEPGGPRKEEPPAAGEPEVLPEDMAALLEAFADPTEAAGKAEEAATVPARGEPPPPDVPAQPAAAPKQGAKSPLGPTAEEEAMRLLAAIQLPSAPTPSAPRPDKGVDALLAQLAPPRSRTATRFQAAAPKPAKPEAGGLDLAAVVEDALGPARQQSEPRAPEAGAADMSVKTRGTLSAEAPADGAEPTAAASAAASASQYGPYRLLEKVAVGGMAEVFRAKRAGVEGFEKIVAVKRILPHLSDNKEFVDMFIDEAKMVAGLTHPNIVQIFDLGKLEKSYYIAMEYVHGRDLRSIQKRAKERGLRIPLDLSVLIVSKVCSALEYAHRKKDDMGRAMKIVHRDISPQNILISFEGDVKLTDFGIAKAATKASTTDRGALRGKLLYMSPEQAWGKPIDRRSDVFSLGIVFYELITEDKPFLGGSEMSILEMVRECRVSPPSASNPRVPETIERVVMKALERDPDARYQDAAEMYKDLERVLLERRPPAATELTRLMELLFDEAERGAAATAGERSEEHQTDSPRPALEMEFHASAGARTDTDPDAEGAPVPREPLSVEQLLKRFGNR